MYVVFPYIIINNSIIGVKSFMHNDQGPRKYMQNIFVYQGGHRNPKMKFPDNSLTERLFSLIFSHLVYSLNTAVYAWPPTSPYSHTFTTIKHILYS